ncbi:40S ribosomal protein S15a [Myotis davidii]|uniref:40S ribosomal protein S15a n=1 Tax=Myotis davidii TaxID=225400 RepID=L5MES1_MYODS|nr:40S ribosomal protein S15a [Myotis davidii]
MIKHGYTSEFEIIDDHRAGNIVVNLTGRLKKGGVTSPRFDVHLKDLEKWQNNLLPSHRFGFTVLENSAGITDRCKKKHTQEGNTQEGRFLRFSF